jgi:hypothetical protein
VCGELRGDQAQLDALARWSSGPAGRVDVLAGDHVELGEKLGRGSGPIVKVGAEPKQEVRDEDRRRAALELRDRLERDQGSAHRPLRRDLATGAEVART